MFNGRVAAVHPLTTRAFIPKRRHCSFSATPLFISRRHIRAGLWNVALLAGYKLTKSPQSNEIKVEFEKIINNNIEIFAQYEHLRWNADQRLNGVSCWDYQKADNSVTKQKLLINGKIVKHMCLVEYEQLDAVSEFINKNIKFNNTSDKLKDFKESDRDNIRNFFIYLKDTDYWLKMISEEEKQLSINQLLQKK